MRKVRTQFIGINRSPSDSGFFTGKPIWNGDWFREDTSLRISSQWATPCIGIIKQLIPNAKAGETYKMDITTSPASSLFTVKYTKVSTKRG